MAIKDGFISELKHEASFTKKMLDRVPWDKKDWKPHEKSMTLGRLATHITETLKWISNIRHIDDFDFMRDLSFEFHTAATKEQLMQAFQENLENALSDLAAMSDEDFNKIWIVRRGEQVMYNMPKKVAVRAWGFSHQVHHRGQLSVFLRLLGVPVPGMYGPSADERM